MARLRSYSLAALAVAAAFAIRWALTPVLGAELPFITLFFAVFFAAWQGGLGPAVAATLLSAVLALFAFIPPRYAFDLTSPIAQIGSIFFVITGFSVGLMGRARLRAQALAGRLLSAANEAATAARSAAAAAERERTRAEDEAVRAEEAAAEADAARSHSEAILEGISDGFMVLGRDFTIRYMNPAAVKLSRRRAEELIGRNHWELFPEGIGTSFDAAYRKALATGQVVRVQDRYEPLDVWIDVSVYPSADGLSVFIQDVSEQRRAEVAAQDSAAELEESNAELQAALDDLHERQAALEQSEERVRLAMDAGAFGAWDWDIPGDRVTWSPRVYEFHGIEPGAFGGKVEDFTKLIHPADQPRVGAAIERALATGEEYSLEFRIVRPNGEVRWLATHGRVLRDAGDAPVRMLGATQDVTERRVAADRLRQVQRMEAAGRLAGGVAHEVNNQMTIVLGLASFILREQGLPEPIRDDVLQIRRAGERSAAITAQLLAFGRRQLLRPEPLQLNEVITEFARVAQKAAGPNVTLKLHLDPSVAPVVADRAQLEQVLLNLTLNAVDAMPAGGTLTIETASATLSGGYGLEHPGVAVTAGRYTLVAVSDTGHGMTPDVLEHVFEPFFTTKQVGEGSGLGLSSVYGIVKQSDGYIWAYSEPGVGTTFKIYLPETPAVPVPAQPSGSARARFGGSERVLVVDDERDVRSLIVRLLEGEGYRVVAAETGAEALEVLQRDGRDVRLVVTDVAMPGVGGSELGRRLRETRPDLPVLYTSGFTDADVVARGLLDRSLPFLQKPFTPDALLERVRAMLDRA